MGTTGIIKLNGNEHFLAIIFNFIKLNRKSRSISWGDAEH